jgi:glucose-6-phosphate isomerase
MTHPSPSSTDIWQALQTHHHSLSGTHLSNLFEAGGSDRFKDFSHQAASIFVDYSKNHITEKTLNLLIALAKERKLSEKIEALFTGGVVNLSENRAALHTALRNRSNFPIELNGQSVMPEINQELNRLKECYQQITSGAWKSNTGETFTDVVNIGAGGSDSGPRMACAALKPFSQGLLQSHFVSNIDGTDIAETLKHLNPNTTLFIVASKSFNTKETLRNAKTARLWLEKHSTYFENIDRHFIAITAEKEKALEFGICENQIFSFWSWVGGRYSLWSAIGLPLILQIGFESFEAFLSGAHAMDKHFRQAQFRDNLPVILGLVDFWYRQFFKTNNHVIIPYEHYLRDLPHYLQQLIMESHGKQVKENGEPLHYPTGAIIWGMVGSNSEHAIHQYLFQGTELCPVDFILCKQTHHLLPEHHQRLYSTCLAQSRALMYGKTKTEAQTSLIEKGVDPESATKQSPHHAIPGNRPSNTILLEKITPYSLGALLALYEHRTFVESVLWEINAFDQFGVELGKQIGNEIFNYLSQDKADEQFDLSTEGLIALYRQKNYCNYCA